MQTVNQKWTEILYKEREVELRFRQSLDYLLDILWTLELFIQTENRLDMAKRGRRIVMFHVFVSARIYILNVQEVSYSECTICLKHIFTIYFLFVETEEDRNMLEASLDLEKYGNRFVMKSSLNWLNFREIFKCNFLIL